MCCFGDHSPKLCALGVLDHCRKEECERQLAQLEKDIERLSGKGPVLVVDE